MEEFSGDLRVVPRPAASASLGSSLEMQILGSSPKCCLASCVFRSPPGDSDEHGNSANHSFKVERAPIHKSIYLPREDGDLELFQNANNNNAGVQALSFSQ